MLVLLSILPSCARFLSSKSFLLSLIFFSNSSDAATSTSVNIFTFVSATFAASLAALISTSWALFFASNVASFSCNASISPAVLSRPVATVLIFSVFVLILPSCSASLASILSISFAVSIKPVATVLIFSLFSFTASPNSIFFSTISLM